MSLVKIVREAAHGKERENIIFGVYVCVFTLRDSLTSLHFPRFPPKQRASPCNHVNNGARLCSESLFECAPKITLHLYTESTFTVVQISGTFFFFRLL